MKIIHMTFTLEEEVTEEDLVNGYAYAYIGGHQLANDNLWVEEQ